MSSRFTVLWVRTNNKISDFFANIINGSIDDERRQPAKRGVGCFGEATTKTESREVVHGRDTVISLCLKVLKNPNCPMINVSKEYLDIRSVGFRCIVFFFTFSFSGDLADFALADEGKNKEQK